MRSSIRQFPDGLKIVCIGITAGLSPSHHFCAMSNSTETPQQRKDAGSVMNENCPASKGDNSGGAIKRDADEKPGEMPTCDVKASSTKTFCRRIQPAQLIA